MNYKLIDGSLNDINNPIETILKNRGIENIKSYENISSFKPYDYSLLDNITEAKDCLKKHLDNEDAIHIVVDSDVDGYTSGSMVYRVIKNIDPFSNVTYSLHTGKQHGLSSEIEIPDNVKLVIIPDAGSNDVDQCKELKDKGVDVIILDHHLCDVENPYAIIVNNQMCNYPNKNFCGAGIVYKFIQCLDEEYWTNFADEVMDMVSLGNISDVMDMREYETKYYAHMGLQKIKSKLFKALIEKQSYSINDKVNIINIQFYITPMLNAMIRVGTQEEKDLLFRAFIEEYEEFDYKKRGSTETVKENIYDRAARLCSNAKARQSKDVQKGVDELNDLISSKNLDTNKLLIVNVTDILSSTLTGLVAIKLAEQYNKPCVLLRRNLERTDDQFYGGSCRNFNDSPIENLKAFLDSTQLFDFVQGHDNAAGVSILRKNVIHLNETCNEMLKDMDFSKCYRLDFILDYEDLSVNFIKSIDDMKNELDIFGQRVDEPLVLIRNIPIWAENFLVMGKTQNSWKVTQDEGFAFVKFNATVDNDSIQKTYNELNIENQESGFIGYMDVIGTVSVNNYNNILTPQVIIKDYDFREAGESDVQFTA